MTLKWKILSKDLANGVREFTDQDHLPFVLTALPSIIPVKLGTLKKGVKKIVISKAKHFALTTLLEPSGLLPGPSDN